MPAPPVNSAYTDLSTYASYYLGKSTSIIVSDTDTTAFDDSIVDGMLFAEENQLSSNPFSTIMLDISANINNTFANFDPPGEIDISANNVSDVVVSQSVFSGENIVMTTQYTASGGSPTTIVVPLSNYTENVYTSPPPEYYDYTYDPSYGIVTLLQSSNVFFDSCMNIYVSTPPDFLPGYADDGSAPIEYPLSIFIVDGANPPEPSVQNIDTMLYGYTNHPPYLTEDVSYNTTYAFGTESFIAIGDLGNPTDDVNTPVLTITDPNTDPGNPEPYFIDLSYNFTKNITSEIISIFGTYQVIEEDPVTTINDDSNNLYYYDNLELIDFGTDANVIFQNLVYDYTQWGSGDSITIVDNTLGYYQIENPDLFLTMNQDVLIDNPTYMKNNTESLHALVFSLGSVTLDPSSNTNITLGDENETLGFEYYDSSGNVTVLYNDPSSNVPYEELSLLTNVRYTKLFSENGTTWNANISPPVLSTNPSFINYIDEDSDYLPFTALSFQTAPHIEIVVQGILPAVQYLDSNIILIDGSLNKLQGGSVIDTHADKDSVLLNTTNSDIITDVSLNIIETNITPGNMSIIDISITAILTEISITGDDISLNGINITTIGTGINTTLFTPGNEANIVMNLQTLVDISNNSPELFPNIATSGWKLDYGTGLDNTFVERHDQKSLYNVRINDFLEDGGYINDTQTNGNADIINDLYDHATITFTLNMTASPISADASINYYATSNESQLMYTTALTNLNMHHVVFDDPSFVIVNTEQLFDQYAIPSPNPIVPGQPYTETLSQLYLEIPFNIGNIKNLVIRTPQMTEVVSYSATNVLLSRTYTFAGVGTNTTTIIVNNSPLYSMIGGFYAGNSLISSGTDLIDVFYGASTDIYLTNPPQPDGARVTLTIVDETTDSIHSTLYDATIYNIYYIIGSPTNITVTEYYFPLSEILISFNDTVSAPAVDFPYRPIADILSNPSSYATDLSFIIVGDAFNIMKILNDSEQYIFAQILGFPYVEYLLSVRIMSYNNSIIRSTATLSDKHFTPIPFSTIISTINLLDADFWNTNQYQIFDGVRLQFSTPLGTNYLEYVSTHDSYTFELLSDQVIVSLHGEESYVGAIIYNGYHDDPRNFSDPNSKSITFDYFRGNDFWNNNNFVDYHTEITRVPTTVHFQIGTYNTDTIDMYNGQILDNRTELQLLNGGSVPLGEGYIGLIFTFNYSFYNSTIDLTITPILSTYDLSYVQDSSTTHHDGIISTSFNSYGPAGFNLIPGTIVSDISLNISVSIANILIKYSSIYLDSSSNYYDPVNNDYTLTQNISSNDLYYNPYDLALGNGSVNSGITIQKQNRWSIQFTKYVFVTPPHVVVTSLVDVYTETSPESAIIEGFFIDGTTFKQQLTNNNLNFDCNSVINPTGFYLFPTEDTIYYVPQGKQLTIEYSYQEQPSNFNRDFLQVPFDSLDVSGNFYEVSFFQKANSGDSGIPNIFLQIPQDIMINTYIENEILQLSPLTNVYNVPYAMELTITTSTSVTVYGYDYIYNSNNLATDIVFTQYISESVYYPNIINGNHVIKVVPNKKWTKTLPIPSPLPYPSIKYNLLTALTQINSTDASWVQVIEPNFISLQPLNFNIYALSTLGQSQINNIFTVSSTNFGTHTTLFWMNRPDTRATLNEASQKVYRVTYDGNVLSSTINTSLTEIVAGLVDIDLIEAIPPLTSSTTIVSGLFLVGTIDISYQNGTYIVSTGSNLASYYPYYVFNSVVTNYWKSNGLHYDINGDYTGGYSTTVGSGAIMGEYIQIQLPYALVLTSYQLVGPPGSIDASYNQNPNRWAVVGSNDVSSWNEVHVIKDTIGQIFPTSQMVSPVYQVSSYPEEHPYEAYYYYRIIFTNIQPNQSSASNRVMLGEWIMYGPQGQIPPP